MSEASNSDLKRRPGFGRAKGVSGAYALKAVPTEANIRRALKAMDAKLTRAEKQIDALLERQARK